MIECRAKQSTVVEKARIPYVREVSPRVKQNIKKLLATGRCSSCDLQDADLTKWMQHFATRLRSVVNLSHSNLMGANLSDLDLGQANLSSANLTNTYLFQANLSDGIMYGSIFCNTTMPDGNVKNQNCDKAKLPNDPSGTRLTKVEKWLEQMKKKNPQNLPLCVIGSGYAKKEYLTACDCEKRGGKAYYPSHKYTYEYRVQCN